MPAFRQRVARLLFCALLLPLLGFTLTTPAPRVAAACCRTMGSHCMQGRRAGQASCCQHCVSAPAPVAAAAPHSENLDTLAHLAASFAALPSAAGLLPSAARLDLAAWRPPPRSAALYTLHASLRI